MEEHEGLAPPPQEEKCMHIVGPAARELVQRIDRTHSRSSGTPNPSGDRSPTREEKSLDQPLGVNPDLPQFGPGQRLKPICCGEKEMVPSRGVEPPLPCGNTDLNRARLPVPPRRHKLSGGALPTSCAREW